jgi:hypothetical protein
VGRLPSGRTLVDPRPGGAAAACDDAPRCILRSVAPRVGTGEREGYATALAGLWGGLSRTLRQLDEIASDPERASLESLPLLQYRLHQAAELVFGIRPPRAAEDAHAELVEALEDARDLTAEVAATGPVDGLLHRWRGALFRVRLARSQVLAARVPRPEPEAPAVEETASSSFAAPLAALTLTLLGAIALTIGAVLGPWPVWVAGVAAVAVGLLVYRP